MEIPNNSAFKQSAFRLIWLIALLLILELPANAFISNGIVQLQKGNKIVIEGPLLGKQAKRFAKIIAYLHKNEVQKVSIMLNSEGGSFDEANYIIGAMLVFQRKGGHIQTVVTANARCWSVCPLIFAFGNTRISDPDSSWLFHRMKPDGKTKAEYSKLQIKTAEKRILDLWYKRFGEIDPDLQTIMKQQHWLEDNQDHGFTGTQLNALSSSFFSMPDS